MKRRLIGLISFILIVYSVFGGLKQFGPALAAEFRYQFLSFLDRQGLSDANLSNLFNPRISFALDPGGTINQSGLVIPKIYLSEPVIKNVDPGSQTSYLPALKQGIAHAEGTGLPGDNKLGYYFAHSSSGELNIARLNAVFYTLNKLEPGDPVYVWSNGHRFDYRVTSKEITDANDVSLLVNPPAIDAVALQTCWPPGTTLKRLIVMAERV